jgi:hypothetical protein
MPKRWTTGCLAKIASDAEYSEVMLTVPKTTKATKLSDFGYKYDEKLRLVQISSGKPFAWLGQKHYDKLGDAIVNEIYAILREKYGMQQVAFPLAQDRRPGTENDTCPVFVSSNFQEAKAVVVLIQGSGAVRPGMWARALCINNSLNEGAIFGYLEQIFRRGWGVVVLNPNENTVLPPEPEPPADLSPDDIEAYWLATPDAEWKAYSAKRIRSAVPIEGSYRPEVHAISAWTSFIEPNPRPTMVIAHSYGGKCTTAILRTRFQAFSELTAAVALTDAINDLHPRQDHRDHIGFFKRVSKNWVGSKRTLDSLEPPGPCGCVEVSSGHDTHEWTSWSCMGSVFPFLDQKLEEFLSANPKEGRSSSKH